MSDQASACVHCGHPIAKTSPPSASNATVFTASAENPGATAFAPSSTPHGVKTAKSRGVYIILGLFFGLLGLHNFY
ncbi:MAG: hypothetical protein ACRD9W_07260, partial [Terriglobia bacterium]